MRVDVAQLFCCLECARSHDWKVVIKVDQGCAFRMFGNRFCWKEEKMLFLILTPSALHKDHTAANNIRRIRANLWSSEIGFKFATAQQLKENV